jgi:hypothetical protein
MIKDAIGSENKIDEMGVPNEEKPSNVKPYRRPHYQERFQGRKEDQYQYYQGRIWNTHQYSWNMESQNHYSRRYYHRPTSTTNWRRFNNDTWNKGKENHVTTRHQGLRSKRIDFGWMHHHQWKEETKNIRKSYYFVSSHVKPFNCKALRTKIFGGYYVMTQGEHIWG